MNKPLVSIIMAAYNAEKYITAAIDSLLAQSYTNWELLVVNDGSTDRTARKILAYEDTRICYFEQANAGVSAARNLALNKMEGDFFLIFDADDVLLPNSLAARVQVLLQHPEVDFVDGVIVQKDAQLEQVLARKTHAFVGNPQQALMRLSMDCFTVPSWLIRRHRSQVYQLRTNMSHAEDLLFYIDISSTGRYQAIDEEILYYRVHGASAMRNLDGLARGYAELYRVLKQKASASFGLLLYLKWRIIRIMLCSYVRQSKFLKAFQTSYRYAFL